MATAKKLPSGSWRIQPCITLSDGTRLRVSITAPTKAEANRLAAQWLASQEMEQELNRNLTVGDAVDQYIGSCEKAGASPTTIKEYKSRRKTAFPLIENCRLSNLTAALIQRNIDHRLEKVSIKTVRNDFYLLKPVLALYAPGINLQRIKLAKKPKRKKIHMQESWRTAIPSKIAEMYGKSDFYLYILFLIFAGVRPSEAYALQWQDLSEEPTTRLFEGNQYNVGYITINKATVRTSSNGYAIKPPKTDAGNRTIELDWSFFAELYSVRPRCAAHDRVFKINPYCNERKWRNVKTALKLPPDLRQYDLRHFHATDIANSGATEEEIMERMGHSTAAFSHAVYVEIFEEHQSALNAALAVRTADAIKHLTS